VEQALTDRLAGERNVWLCTLRPDGSPHLVPIWFVWADGSFWMCTSSTSVKDRNLRRDPRASVALEDGDAPAVAQGTARLHARPYPDHLVAAFQAKFGWDITEPGDDGDWATMIELPVERWLFAGSVLAAT
jgi:F420H(2)-dependent biliverdin reductase